MQGRKFKQITQEERIRIEVLLQQGSSYSKIACLLKRSVSTISREIRRNSSVAGKRPVYYCARIADKKAIKRHRLKRKRIYFDERMKRFINKWLVTERLSPELIAVKGRQQREHFVSHEWIYQWIWHMKFSMCQADRKWQGLYKYLKHGRRYRKRGHVHTKRGNIINRVWIDQRPPIVGTRSRLGDAEADIILGKNRQPGLLVVLDRKSRKTWLRKLKTKEAGYVIDKIKDVCSKSTHRIKTITLDNDQSFAQHYRLNKESRIKTYFTHPYSSQEKGSVENRIGIIRMFFGKKTDFTKVSRAKVKTVENIINNRALKLFNYKTPNELYEKKLCIY